MPIPFLLLHALGPRHVTWLTHIRLIRLSPSGVSLCTPSIDIFERSLSESACSEGRGEFAPASLQKCVGNFVVQILEAFAGRFHGGFFLSTFPCQHESATNPVAKSPLEDRNLLKFKSLDTSCPSLLSDDSIWGQ